MLVPAAGDGEGGGDAAVRVRLRKPLCDLPHPACWSRRQNRRSVVRNGAASTRVAGAHSVPKTRNVAAERATRKGGSMSQDGFITRF